MKDKVILCVYGEGGHRAEMSALLKNPKIKSVLNNKKLVSIYENNDFLDFIDIKYEFPILRSKYSILKTFVLFIFNFFQCLYLTFKIHKKYDVKLVISTGPGISILPSFFFYLNSVNVIFIENSCKFYRQSYAGYFLKYFVNYFYVQNKELKIIYPKSIYSGKLL